MLDDFVVLCRAAAATGAPDALPRITAAMKSLVADPAALAESIPRPDPASAVNVSGFDVTLHEDDDVTVMVVHAPPDVVQPPHDHLISAVIGVYAGNETQRFWRRADDGIVATGGQSLTAGETLALGPRAIHAITAGAGEWSRAVHVYLGRLATVERSLFDPDTLAEEPLTSERYETFCALPSS